MKDTEAGWVRVKVSLWDIPEKVAHPRDWAGDIPCDDRRWIPQTLGDQLWIYYLNPDTSNVPSGATIHRDDPEWMTGHWVNYDSHNRADCHYCSPEQPSGAPQGAKREP